MTKYRISVVAALIAILLLCVSSPIGLDDDSDATASLSLNTESAVLYLSGGTNQIILEVTDPTPGTITWQKIDIDDGLNVVSLVTDPNDSTKATATAGETGSIKIVATSSTGATASAIIVVFSSPGTSTDVFHFWIQIDELDFEAAVNSNSLDVTLPALPPGFDFFDGFWITVDNNVENIANFNAFTALERACQLKGWDFDAQQSGWINTFLNLGTYSGEGGSWVYWVQYHLNLASNTWDFNNVTLGYMTTVEEQYVGMIFRESTSPDSNGVAVPELPNGANTLSLHTVNP